MVWSNSLCERVSRVKIKRKLATKQKLWGLISAISYSWKWLAPIVFSVSIIQQPSRKGVWYGFNVPNCYLKTKVKYEHDKKHFSDSVNKVFQKPWHSFNPIMYNALKWSDTLWKSVSICYKSFKVCLTISGYYAWKAWNPFKRVNKILLCEYRKNVIDA